MKKEIMSIFIFGLTFITGCHKTPTLSPPINDSPTSDVMIETNFLNAPVFIDLENQTSIYLPKTVENHVINWTYDQDVWHYNNQLLTIKANGKTTISANVIKENYIYSETFTFHIEKRKIIKSEQHGLVFYYDFLSPTHYKVGNYFKPKMLVIHNTANTASAYNEIRYLHNKNNTSKTSYHFAVDDIGIYQAIPTTNYAYHAGNYTINQQSIGIEIAKSMLKDPKIKDQATANAIKLSQLLMKHFNISIDMVITHYDASGKGCPHDIIDRYGIDKFYQNLNENKILSL